MNDAKADAKEVFLSALDCTSPEDLARYLDESCGGDAALRGRVEELLRARREAGSFLGGRWTSATEELAIAESPGTVIGPYKLLQQIGEGGMGVVFMAEQTEPIQRTVALKIIKPGMDTRQVIARFEAERQAVAMMDHPNIAKVLDAGTTESGRPYFVMELVKGVPITKYCDEKQLPLRARMELFVQVCQAVQHAHQKGIIHRDIKPNNVLVAEYDNHAVPKVIDFGVAKATARRLTERTMFTEFGQVLGTMEYMSPEQSKFNQLDIDTRSDIYSLGVLLYELLAGSTPFGGKRLHEAAFDEMLRIIREEEPPKPSTRLTASDTLPSIAANRHTEPAKLSKEIQGELDWIVMRSLEKDRQRRYQTASALADDLQHYLTDQPVAACPPSTAYRLKKFIRRNKASVLAGSAIAAALVVGMGISTWMFFRERAARQQAVAAEQVAKSEANKNQQVAQFLKDMLAAAGPGVARGRDATLLREIVDGTVQRIGKDLKDQPEVEADMRRTIGWVYEKLGQYDQAENMFRQALAVGRSHFGSEHPDVAKSLGYLGFILYRQGKLGEAEAAFRESLAMQRNLGQSEHEDVAFSLNGLAIVLASQRKLPEAEAKFRESLAIYRKLLGNDSPLSSNVLANLAHVLFEQGKLAEAEAMFREAIAIVRDDPGAVPDTTPKMMDLAAALQQEGKLAEAEATYRETLSMERRLVGKDHPFVGGMLDGLANVLLQQGNLAESEAMYREALAVRRKAAESMPNNPGALSDLAGTLATCPFKQLRDPERAVELATRAAELAPQTGSCWNTLGVARYRAGEWQPAIEALEKSMELRSGGDATDWFFLAMAKWQLGHKDEATKWYDKAVEWTDKHQPNNEELRRFRVEADELLGIKRPKPTTEQAPAKNNPGDTKVISAPPTTNN